MNALPPAADMPDHCAHCDGHFQDGLILFALKRPNPVAICHLCLQSLACIAAPYISAQTDPNALRH